MMISFVYIKIINVLNNIKPVNYMSKKHLIKIQLIAKLLKYIQIQIVIIHLMILKYVIILGMHVLQEIKNVKIWLMKKHVYHFLLLIQIKDVFIQEIYAKNNIKHAICMTNMLHLKMRRNAKLFKKLSIQNALSILIHKSV